MSESLFSSMLARTAAANRRAGSAIISNNDENLLPPCTILQQGEVGWEGRCEHTAGALGIHQLAGVKNGVTTLTIAPKAMGLGNPS